jgi:hypothetical protein
MSAAARIGRGLKGRKSGKGWSVVCPCHNDKNPSLSVTDGDDGKLLLKCFAGCDFRDILAELRRRDLVDDYDQGPRMKSDFIFFKSTKQEKVGKSDPPTAYVYYKADGTPRLRVNRTQNNAEWPFWQEYWDGERFVRGGGSEPKVPYRLAELIANPHATVLICEGEKDVDNVRALHDDIVATTSAGGELARGPQRIFQGPRCHPHPRQ